MQGQHLLRGIIARSRDGGPPRLKSRRPFVPAAQSFLDSTNQRRDANWINKAWSTTWCNKNTVLHAYCPTTQLASSDRHLPRLAWTRFNHLRTGVGRFKATLHKWGLCPSAACDCGADSQTAGHIINACPLYRPPNGMNGLLHHDEATTKRLVSGCPDI